VALDFTCYAPFSLSCRSFCRTSPPPKHFLIVFPSGTFLFPRFLLMTFSALLDHLVAVITSPIPPFTLIFLPFRAPLRSLTPFPRISLRPLKCNAPGVSFLSLPLFVWMFWQLAGPFGFPAAFFLFFVNYRTPHVFSSLLSIFFFF